MSSLQRAGVAALRRVAGDGSTIERRLRRSYRRLRARRLTITAGDGYRQTSGERFVLVESDRPGPPVGVFAKGGCDLASLFLTAPLVRDGLAGTYCVFSQGIGISDSRADILLQTLEDIPEDVVRETCDRLRLPIECFRPHLFEPTFEVPALRGRTFPKTVVALSVGPHLVRTAYRHREHGFLVDPGGWWLNHSMEGVLSDRETASWFRQNFRSTGRLTVDEFREQFGRVIELVQQRTGAEVLVFNALVVDPGNPTHNYQFVKNPASQRRRAFAIALADLSRDLDFHVVDADRVLKGAGVATQVDFAHYMTAEQQLVAEAAHRVLDELGIV